MILKALEEAYQAQCTKGEPIMTFDLDRLQIEHVMPQAWQEHWPLPDGADPASRAWAVNGIGNLTLISDRLNPSLSNGPWLGADGACKRDGLQRHSRLELNRRLLDAHPVFDDEGIADRADHLFGEARLVWPSAPLAA